LLNLANIERDLAMLRQILEVIELLVDNKTMGFRKISEKTDLPPHVVKYILSILQLDYIVRTSGKGSVLTPNAKQELKFLEEDLEILIQELKEAKDHVSRILKKLEEQE